MIWIKILAFLQTTKTYGPIVKTVIKMALSLKEFALFFFVILIAFTFIFYIKFMTNEEYWGFTTTWVNLFSSAIGNFDFSPFIASF